MKPLSQVMQVKTRSIDFVSGVSRTTLASEWLGECLAAANLELGLRWVNDYKPKRPPTDKSGKVNVWPLEVLK